MANSKTRHGYVYLVTFTRPTDGREFYYVGQRMSPTLDRTYLGSGVWLRSLINKYGLHRNFHLRVLDWAYDQDELNFKEIMSIYFARITLGKSCINLSHGGANGAMSESTKQKLRIANLGKKMSEDAIARTVAAHTGSKRSDETRARISEGLKSRMTDAKRQRCRLASLGRLHSEEEKVKMRAARVGRKPNLGNHHSEETKLHLSLVLKGRKRPAHLVEALRAALKGVPKSEEAKANMRKAKALARINPLTCPHCGKSGTGNMTRYHFDNCST